MSQNISTIIQRVEFGQRSNRILELSVHTDLSQYSQCERQNHCLQLKFDERFHNRDIFMNCVIDTDPRSFERIQGFLTNGGYGLGLTAVVVYYDKTELKFTSISHPKTEYSCIMDNRKQLNYKIEKPREVASLYDYRFGQYDQISITGQCHVCHDDNVTVGYRFNSKQVYEEVARLCDPVNQTTSKNSQFIIIETTRFQQI